jgi:hypothetical protein
MKRNGRTTGPNRNHVIFWISIWGLYAASIVLRSLFLLIPTLNLYLQYLDYYMIPSLAFVTALLVVARAREGNAWIFFLVGFALPIFEIVTLLLIGIYSFKSLIRLQPDFLVNCFRIGIAMPLGGFVALLLTKQQKSLPQFFSAGDLFVWLRKSESRLTRIQKFLVALGAVVSAGVAVITTVRSCLP